MKAGLMERILLKWKREWWKKCCWNGSKSDENNVAEVLINERNVWEVKSGGMKKCSWNGSGNDENNVAEMEAVLL